MTTRFDSVNAMRHLRSVLLQVQKEKDERAGSRDDRTTTVFCNEDNIEDAISTLTEVIEN